MKKKIFNFSTSTPRIRDYVIKGFSPNEGFRFSFVDNSQALKTAVNNFKIKDKKEIETLGHCFSSSLMISSFLKSEERIKVALGFNSNSLTYDFYAESMANGEIRGYCKTKEISNETPSDCFLKISKTLYNHTEESNSTLELPYDQHSQWGIFDSEALMRYFKKSDQILTFADLCTKHIENENNLSVGCLLQKMPGCSEGYLSNVFQAILRSKEWENIKNLKTSESYFLIKYYLSIILCGYSTSTFKEFSFESIVGLFKSIDIRVEFQKYPLDFYCRCSLHNFKLLLVKIGKENLAEMKKNGHSTLVCFYCNKEHKLGSGDFKEIDDMIEKEEQNIKIEKI